MEKLTVFAPAKVNLHLAVLDRRPDGFHNLESVFVAVDFGDTLHFEPLEGRNLAEIAMVFRGNREGMPTFSQIPVEKNIIFKALSLFRAKTGYYQGFKINVEKYIPLGSGLGGGSSDAAATLLALNKLAGFPLSLEELLNMAAVLGSDVPFFIYETSAALVKGRGECIEPIAAPDWSLVLVNPGFSSDTAKAFVLLDECRKNNFNYSRLEELKFELFFNDFLPVFSDPEKSMYGSIISALREQGAVYANLSGTGSTCFGVFLNREQAEKASTFLRRKWSFVECCSVNIHCEQKKIH